MAFAAVEIRCRHCPLVLVPEGDPPAWDDIVLAGTTMATHLRDMHGDEKIAIAIERHLIHYESPLRWRP